MSISSLPLELWQFSFIRDLTRNPEIEDPCLNFCLKTQDWSKLEKLNLVLVFVISCY